MPKSDQRQQLAVPQSMSAPRLPRGRRQILAATAGLLVLVAGWVGYELSRPLTAQELERRRQDVMLACMARGPGWSLMDVPGDAASAVCANLGLGKMDVVDLRNL